VSGGRLAWSRQPRPGFDERHRAVLRLLDLLAAYPPRRRPAALRSLGLRVDRRTERLTLALVALWEAAQWTGDTPTVHEDESGGGWFDTGGSGTQDGPHGRGEPPTA
jgi:hypothetical protein